MAIEKLTRFVAELWTRLQTLSAQPDTYAQIGLIAAVSVVAYLLARRIRTLVPVFDGPPAAAGAARAWGATRRPGRLVFPLLVLVMLRIAVDISHDVLGQSWLVQTALSIAVLCCFTGRSATSSGADSPRRRSCGSAFRCCAFTSWAYSAA